MWLLPSWQWMVFPRYFRWLFSSLCSRSPPPGKAFSGSQGSCVCIPDGKVTHHCWYFVEGKGVPSGVRWPGCELWLHLLPAAWNDGPTSQAGECSLLPEAQLSVTNSGPLP